MKKTLFILSLVTIQATFAQQYEDYFEKGFREGYELTLDDAQLSAYKNRGDSRKCQTTKIYTNSNEKNVNEKLYGDGYRCGVQQGAADITKFKNEISQAYEAKKVDNSIEPSVVRDYNEEQKRAGMQVAKNVERNSASSVQQSYYNASVLQDLRNKQIQSQNQYQQELTGGLNSLANSMQALAYQQIQKELDRRLATANTFANYHSAQIEKLQNFYGSIPPSNFSKNLNGTYPAHILGKKKYSFVNNQELVNHTPALVIVENNVIKNIYLYGKEKMQSDLPKRYPQNSTLSNGFAVYSDYKTLESTTILILEPYTSNNTENYTPASNEVSYITLWSSDKKDEGKTIYIQELDKKGNIIQEVSAPINYSKNSKMVDDSFPKIALNSNNKLLFFGEITETPFGKFPLYPRMSKSDAEPLKDNETRVVEIKKYRE